MVRESRPSFRSPTGRGTPLNGVQRRFEACREHDAWHKAMCKRNIANMVVSADHARKEGGKLGCLSNNNIPKKTNYSFGKGLSLFLNRSRHPPCSCSSVDQSRRVLTLWSWVRFPYTARYDSMPVGSSRRGSHDHATRVRYPRLRLFDGHVNIVSTHHPMGG